MSHRARPKLSGREPLHITLRLRPGLPSLRLRATYSVLRHAFRQGRSKFGFRLAHYSVQSNHIHLVCEANHKRALSLGMQGLKIRVARRLNRQLGRHGKLFGDRYHARILRTPREVKNVLGYVYNNAHKHGALQGRGADEFTSAAWFNGFRWHVWDAWMNDVGTPAVTKPETWLLKTGWWLRHGALTPGRPPPATAAR